RSGRWRPSPATPPPSAPAAGRGHCRSRRRTTRSAASRSPSTACWPGSTRQRAFVADAAHELRSPLASIRTAVEVSRLPGAQAGDGADGGDDWRATADDVLEDTARMSRLVDDLLLLARLDDAREARQSTGAETATGDLAAVADRVVERLERQHGRSVRVTREGCGSVRVGAGEDALERVVVNLVENAVRYARSRVEVAVQRSGDDALLTVAD